MSGPTEEFAHMWEWFFYAHCRTTSPLYARISLAVAGNHELLDLVRAAPPSAHLPPALLAAVHEAHDEDEVPDVLGAMIFDHGQRRAQLLAFAQEHGGQLDWRAP